MTKQRKGALIALVVGLVFVALEMLFQIRTGLAGIFVVGMAGGLMVGDEMTRRGSAPPASAPQP